MFSHDRKASMFDLITWHAYMTVLLYGAGEALLTLSRRAGNKTRKADKGSLVLLWLVIPVAVLLALLIGRHLEFADLPFFRTHHEIGIALMLAGILLRIYAVVYLGRFFTVNVAIAQDHTLIDTGPYRWIRHPSYTGILMVYLGIGLCLANGVALAIILLPSITLMLWRIRIEENALQAGLGASYSTYMQRTARLLPWIY